jgi:hypothetical protein
LLESGVKFRAGVVMGDVNQPWLIGSFSWSVVALATSGPNKVPNNRLF